MFAWSAVYAVNRIDDVEVFSQLIKSLKTLNKLK